MRPDASIRGPWLAKWHSTVGPLSARSSRLVMAISAAVAAPLCAMAQVRPFCIHLYGPQAEGNNDNGRQAVIRLPTCVYERDAFQTDYWSRFARRRAVVHDETEDGLLLLSGFDDVPHSEVIDSAGAHWFDRHRSAPRFELRRDRVTLSCGSMPIDPALLRKANGPGKSWILNVPTDARTGEGMFEVPISSFDRCVPDAAADDCAGGVGVLWLAHLNSEGRAIADRWKAEDYSDARIVDPVSHLSWIEVAATFSRIATAGEEATRVGLTGWAPGTAREACWKCLVDMAQADAQRAGLPVGMPGNLTLNAIRPDEAEGTGG